ncbi:MAG: hypothetical protein AAF441_06215 [Pseudomonadota bacterium]
MIDSFSNELLPETDFDSVEREKVRNSDAVSFDELAQELGDAIFSDHGFDPKVDTATLRAFDAAVRFALEVPTDAIATENIDHGSTIRAISEPDDWDLCSPFGKEPTNVFDLMDRLYQIYQVMVDDPCFDDLAQDIAGVINEVDARRLLAVRIAQEEEHGGGNKALH